MRALDAFDPDILFQAGAFFGGGTAIALSLDEYRESVDIDFMCSSTEGYRDLRSRVFHNGLQGLLKPGRSLTQAREPRMDMYNIRLFPDVEGMPVKTEVVSENRISLSGAMDPKLGVPVLSRVDMYAEKLLANADRGNDAATMHRDMIDLGMMISRWGPVPQAAWDKAESFYGSTVRTAFDREALRIRDDGRLQQCARKMDMTDEVAREAQRALGGPLPRTRGKSRGFDLGD